MTAPNLGSSNHRPVTRRYPLQPLADACGVTLAHLGRLLRTSGSTWKGYRDEGVSELVADRLAARAGFVAYEVWPEMVQHQIDDTEAIEEERRRRLLTQKAESARRRYWSDPEVRDKKIKTAAAYRERGVRAKRIADAGYRERNRALIAAKQRERDRRRRAEQQGAGAKVRAQSNEEAA